MPTLRHRLAALLGRSRSDRELDEEMRLHLERLEGELRAEGLDATEARRRARQTFGPAASLREEARDARGLLALEELARDLRFGLRTLLRRPGFLIVVVLTLGIGVGGSAAIFGAVNGILLRPLPYPAADRVVAVWQHDRRSGNDRQEASPANFLDWRERQRTFERLTAIEPFGLDWLSPDGTVYLSTWLAYEGFFEVFGTPPLLGRTFTDDEHQPGRGDVVVLGYDLWLTRFGGAPDIVGRVLSLDGRPHTVIGVMPEAFAIPSNDIVWAPKVLQGWEVRNRTSDFYAVFGRLPAGVTLDDAQADLDTIAAHLGREYPASNASSGVALVPLPDQILGGARTALWLLFGAVALVLAVVTASVASLQFSRAVTRGREFAVRAALGAGRWRVARQLVAENLIVAGLGAGLGFVLARFALRGIRALAPADLPRLTELTADGAVFLFAAGLSLLVALATGVVPVLVAGSARLQPVLAQGGRALTGGHRLTRIQSALVVFQCCASLVLLAGAGLLIRSFVAVLSEPAGFRTDGVVALTVQTWNDYPEPASRVAFAQQVLERVSALPGVTAAGMTSSVPLMETIGAELAPVAREDAPPLPAGESAPTVQFAIAAGDVFEAFAIPLLGGRLFDARDHAAAPPVVLINEAFAQRFFPDTDPVGRRIVLSGSATGGPPESHEIVGLVGDVRRFALHQAPPPTVYLAHAQAPTGANAFVVQGTGRTADLLQQLKAAVWQLNPAMPVYLETTMSDLLGESVRDRRFLLVLLSAFAALALSLAAFGMFGLMSFITTQRAREYGVRLALGAPRIELAALVLRQGLALAAIGTSLGFAGALTVTRVLAGLLYEVTPFDPLTLAAAALVLATTALLASLYPATRAAGMNPSHVLQS